MISFQELNSFTLYYINGYKDVVSVLTAYLLAVQRCTDAEQGCTFKFNFVLELQPELH